MERCRILALIGSGETSPTMVTLHRGLLSRLGSRKPNAMILATPYAFQENAEGVSAKARAYFARSVGLDVTVADDADRAAVCAADWVFSGPGSPSFALARWRSGPVAESLRYRVRAGEGITVLASAAAATAGRTALPVYEIYKAGITPHWLDGLDLLGMLGIQAAAIPHYDNAEGGPFDTRYCYLGERRLDLLERELPSGTGILGIDEHTALIMDLVSGTALVAGRGTVTVRCNGRSTPLPPGTSVTIADLGRLARGRPGGAGHVVAETRSRPADALAVPAFEELAAAAERGFSAALAAGDAGGMTRAALELEALLADWATDTEEDMGAAQGRELLRAMITRLGQAPQRASAGDAVSRWDPAVGTLADVRETLRGQGLYAPADAIRDALRAAGFQLQDAADGPRWTPLS